MRALLFAYYFPPLGGIGSLRALGLARHLPAAGVEVTVIAPRTGTYGHDSSLEVPGHVRVVRTGTLEPGVLLRRGGGDDAAGAVRSGESGGGGLRRGLKNLAGRLLHVPDANVGWVPPAVRAGMREGRERRPDVVLSSSPPLSAHLAASRVAKRLGVPFVADFRDFFETQRLYGGIRAKVDTRIEDGVLGRAVGLIAPTEGVRASLAKRSGAPSFLLRNGYDEEDFAGPAPERRDGPFRIVHVGSSYARRTDPTTFFAAAADLAKDGMDFRLRFVGPADDALLAAAAAAGATDLIETSPFTTHACAVREMRRADALLLYVWAGPKVVAHGVFAGKTLEYLRSERPLLVVGPGEGENVRVLDEWGDLLWREPTDQDGIRDALRALVEGRSAAPVAPVRIASETRKAQAERLAVWLEELIGSRR